LQHESDHELPLRRREERGHVVDDARRIGDGVVGEHQRIQPAVAHACAQRFGIHGPVQPQQPTDAVQREAETELDRHEAGIHAQEQRPAVGAVGHLQGDDACSSQPERHRVQLRDAGVGPGVVVELEIAPAAHHTRVDTQADPIWWDELQRDAQPADIFTVARVVVAQAHFQTHAAHDERQRGDLRGNVHA